jgi:hypothetical protein
MHDRQVDRLARRLGRRLARRELLATIGAALMAIMPGRSRAQIAVPSCRAEGEACTHLAGCCAGLLCATSMINVNDVVCIPGEGDVAVVTRALVTPGDAAMVALHIRRF